MFKYLLTISCEIHTKEVKTSNELNVDMEQLEVLVSACQKIESRERGRIFTTFPVAVHISQTSPVFLLFQVSWPATTRRVRWTQSYGWLSVEVKWLYLMQPAGLCCMTAFSSESCKWWEQTCCTEILFFIYIYIYTYMYIKGIAADFMHTFFFYIAWGNVKKCCVCIKLHSVYLRNSKFPTVIRCRITSSHMALQAIY